MHRKAQKFLNRLKAIHFIYKLLFILIIVLCIITILLNPNEEWSAEDWRYCFMDPHLYMSEPVADHSKDFEPLEDVILSDIKPKPGRSIFFHETTCSPKNSNSKTNFTLNSIKLNARQSCAVESAALHNPNFDIFVLFAAPTFWNKNDLSSTPLIEAITSYSNVHIRNLNLWTYAAGTPIYGWLHMGKLFRSSYVLSHVSDFLRYLTLWRYGGTYLDMDTVMTKTIENLKPNYAGAESSSHIAAGVINFDYKNFGHQMATKCLEDFEKNFNGGNWGNNGPGVITRIVKKVCKMEKIIDMINTCKDFKVFDRGAFYSIPWVEWTKFFEEKDLEEAMQRLNQSYIIHVWNKLSSHQTLQSGARAAYTLIAEKNCPKVFAAAGLYF